MPATCVTAGTGDDGSRVVRTGMRDRGAHGMSDALSQASDLVRTAHTHLATSYHGGRHLTTDRP